MPKPLQLAVLDRPGLSKLPVADAARASRLLEPLNPPQDDAATGWVLNNLGRCLSKLLPDCSGDSRAWLTAHVDSATSTAALFPSPTGSPKVTLHSDKATLWTCLLALDGDAPSPKLHRLLGALYVLLANGGKSPSEQAMEVLLRACVATRAGDQAAMDVSTAAALIACGRLLTMALTQLGTAAITRRSAATSMVEAKVERAIRGGYRFDTNDKVEGATAPRGLTANDITEAGPKLRDGAQNGLGGALLTAIAHWHGVLPLDMRDMPIFSPSPGFMRVDPTCSYTVIKLGGILTELARTELSGVLVAGDELHLPWPRWMSELMRPLRESNRQARSIADLPGMPASANELRRLLEGLDLPRRITASKLVVDRAQPLIRPDIDAVLRALAALDFSRIFKVSAAYEHVRPDELLRVLTLRAMLLGWGELSPSPVPSHGYLSAVTPELARVRAVGARLRKELVDSYPGPNADPPAVFAHHAAFIRYTIFLIATGLALRGQERTLLPASMFLVNALAGEFDKALPKASASPADMVLGAVLQLQLRYLRAHYRALIDRLTKGLSRYSPQFAKIASDLGRVVEGDPTMPLLVLVQQDGLQAFSLLDLVEYLGEDWSGKADAVRHAVPFILRSYGAGYANREAAMRHVGGSQPIVSATSAWSSGQWQHEASKLQDMVFGDLDVQPHGGLIRSLGRGA